jgi:hypothetical protein
VYERTVEGEGATFGVSGKLWKDALVMYDRETRSLWSHVLGECVDGERMGEVLEVFPSVQTTWEEWRRAHPETKALLKDEGEKQEESGYARYFDSPDRMGIHGTVNPDDRLAGKDLVLGIRHGRMAAAYPLKLLEESPVVNDTIDNTPVLVAYSAESRAAYAYVRKVNRNTIRFEPYIDEGRLYLRDERTGSIWDPVRGEAQGGILAGKQLAPLPASQVFWFAWRGYFPRTRLWSPEGP